ncbi:MAG TPA: chorismate synthase [Phycisphaerales bacterium]|nr:chorismate synthase [Phycisphaerales bacterium]
MPRLSYITAGESHGPAVLAVVSGLPAGMDVDVPALDAELARRQGGYGRSGRQRLEEDRAEIVSGLYLGRTIGSPLAILIRNRDARLDDPERTPPVHAPRPGHADLAGALKYRTTDVRGVLERASARETAARTAAGAVARQLMTQIAGAGDSGVAGGSIGPDVFAFVRAIGGEATDVDPTPARCAELRRWRAQSETYCPDPEATRRQVEAIRRAKIEKDTLGGILECHVFGAPPGLGSTMDWRDRLDARLAAAAMSIQAIKAVEIGLGFGVAARPGSRVHDPIGFDRARAGGVAAGFVRASNHAGGIEGGMSNGAPIVVRAAMKPISTLLRGMPSVDLRTLEPVISAYERSDVCAAPAASVVLENVIGFEIAAAMLEKFGGDTLADVRAAHAAYRRSLGEVFPG